LQQIYPGRYAPDVLVKLLKTEKVTVSHCVPTVLQMILSSPAARDHDFKGWRVIIGASALSKALCQEAMSRGIDVNVAYGMSETCPVLSISRVQPELVKKPEDEIYYRTKAGLPPPLVDLRIVDGQMREVPHDGVSAGEIVARAPWLARGYHKNEPATEELWAGGYLHTQDIGTIDGNGYLMITDRIKDVIKTGGEWVSSLELEDIIGQHPRVAEVAVIGVEDAKWGERPLAIVLLREGVQPEPADIKAHIMQHVMRGAIPKYAVPETILFVESIDKTSVGKLDKKALRQKYGTQPAAKLPNHLLNAISPRSLKRG
jgi:fatty-acyl-CoA synthase